MNKISQLISDIQRRLSWRNVYEVCNKEHNTHLCSLAHEKLYSPGFENGFLIAHNFRFS